MHTVAPETVGLSSKRLSRIDDTMQRYVDEGKLAGIATTVARHGEIAQLETYGLMDVASNKPMQLDTIFRIYSMTKPITSVALMMLYEEGRFLLTDPVSRFVPEFKETQVYVSEGDSGPELANQEQPMAIWHLLTHTSGLVYGSQEGSAVENMVWQDDRKTEETIPDETLAEWAPRLARLPLAHQPGSAWHYGHSTDLLGRIVEVISGQPLDTFFQERILEPLGMVDTAFHVPAPKIERFATNYGPTKDGGIQVIDAPETSPYAKPRRFLPGGEGLVSTIGDYVRFAQMLLNKGDLDGTRLLGRKTVELMTTNHLPAGLHPFERASMGFGLGFAVTLDAGQAHHLVSKGQYAWVGSAGTAFRVDPREDLLYVLMTQLTPGGTYPIRDEFDVLVHQAIVD